MRVRNKDAGASEWEDLGSFMVDVFQDTGEVWFSLRNGTTLEFTNIEREDLLHALKDYNGEENSK